MIIPLPENVLNIINELNDHGYAAYAVGGCVRDVLIDRVPGDWDITTSARPMEIKSLFRRTVDTGIQHGTVTVLVGDESYEVTTFRVDGEYRDSRHPEKVTFVPDLKEDLLRRDFTINAMAYNDREGLIDLYGGMKDLEQGIIRCVGIPEERFREDALRMMRAVRFSAQLGFIIEEQTIEAISGLCGNISMVSAERIQTELVKLVMSEHPEKWDIAVQTGLAGLILPELLCAWQNDAGVVNGQLYYDMIRNLRADRSLRLAALLYGLNESEAAGIMKRLKFDNAAYYMVKALIRLKNSPLPCNEYETRVLLNQVGDEVFLKNLELKEAWAREKGALGGLLTDIEKAAGMYRIIRDRGDCTDIKSLAIDGNDIIGLGIVTGPLIGEKLNQALEEVLVCPEKNDKEYLLGRIINNK